MSNKENIPVIDKTPRVKRNKAINPMAMIAQAQENNASIEQMQQLLDLQIRYEHNEARKAYHAALSNFKSEELTITKDSTVDYTTNSGRVKYDHASLGDIVKKVGPVLSKYGLSHNWEVNQTDRIEVICKLTHSDGYSERVSMTADADSTGKKNAIQAIGSTVTYLQRYSLMSILGLAATDLDDDGAAYDKVIVEVLTDDELANIDALITETGTDLEKFLVFLQVAELTDIPRDKYKFAIKQLEGRRK